MTAIREKVCPKCSTLSVLDAENCVACGCDFQTRFDAGGKAVKAISASDETTQMGQSRPRLGRFIVSLLFLSALLLGATWFGLRLGPRSPPSSSGSSGDAGGRAGAATTQAAASFAARGFVREAIRRQPDTMGEVVLSPLEKVGQNDSDPAVWGASGTGVVGIRGRPGLVPIEWRTQQSWDGETHQWQLKDIVITRPKQRE